MTFFDPPPVPEPIDDEPEQPEWIGPPSGVVGGVVATQLLLVQIEDLVVVATHIAVYPNGIAFRIDGVSRVADPSWGRGGLPGFPGDDPVEGLRIGVLYPDGRKAQTHVSWPAMEEDGPAGPVLMGGAGGGGGRSWQHDHWLWPLPPPGDLEVVVAWPARGVPETRARIAGELIEEARGRIIEAWPGSRAPRASGVIAFLRTATEDDPSQPPQSQGSR